MQSSLHSPVLEENATGLAITWHLKSLGRDVFMVSRKFARTSYLGFWWSRAFVRWSVHISPIFPPSFGVGDVVYVCA